MWDKYNPQGDLLEHFSPEKPGDVTLIEAWNPLRIFLFYSDFQEYMFLDRFLTSSNRFSFHHISSYVGLATMSADNNIWLVDYSDFSLKKYDLTFDKVIIQQPFDLLLNKDSYEVEFMREYQNLLFFSVVDKGILIFDNLGNYLKTLEETGIGYFGFLKNELYYVKDSELHFYDIYSAERRKEEMPSSADLAMVLENRLLLISGTDLLICNRKK